MKRIVLVVAMAGVVLLLALELAVRGGGRTTLLAPEDALTADRRGWCGGAWLETDARGARDLGSGGSRGATTTSTRGGGRLVHVIGGAFTAGAGLEADELYVARLDARARQGGWSGAVAIARSTPEGKIEEIGRLLASGALGPKDALVVEIDGGDLGAEPRWFGIEAPARRVLAPVAPSASAALTWLRLVGLRRERRRFESEVSELVARDGFTGRAAAQSKVALERLTDAVATRRLEPSQVGRLRAWLDELCGLARQEARTERIAAWRAVFEELLRANVLAVAVVTGPTLPTLGLVEEARNDGLALLHAPPFELDPELRIDAPFPRPAAAVHAQVADSIAAVLTRRGAFTGTAAASEALLAAADAIEQQVMSRGGFDEATITLARGVAGTSVSFPDGGSAANVLRGIAPDGRLEPGDAAEIVLRRPNLSEGLVVRGEAADGAEPRLGLRHRAGGATATPRVVGPVPGKSGRVLLEWRFAPPPAKSPVDYPGLELALLPSEAGDPPAPVDLREVRYLERAGEPQER